MPSLVYEIQDLQADCIDPVFDPIDSVVLSTAPYKFRNSGSADAKGHWSDSQTPVM